MHGLVPYPWQPEHLPVVSVEVFSLKNLPIHLSDMNNGSAKPMLKL